jgi:hypothetical protein
MGNTKRQVPKSMAGCIKVADIANIYFPQYSKTETAKKKFRTMIRESKKLYNELIKNGYNEESEHLTPIQNDLIFSFWGKPKHYTIITETV